MDLAEVAAELYGLPPVDFVPQRSRRAAQARADGDRDLAAAISALRKPTAAAWAVNQLVRHEGEAVAALLALGAELREAQATLSGEDLRRLTAQRRQAVSALARTARGVAAELGHPISEATEEEAAQTLLAALADPAVGEAVSSGRLTTALSYSGVGPVEGVAAAAALAGRPALRVVAGGATTAPGEPGAPGDDAGRRARDAAQVQRREALARARRRLSDAEADAAAAQDAAHEAARASRDATSAHEAAQARVEELTAALEAAQRETAAARQAAGRAERARVDAQRRSARALGVAEAARREVERLS